jgi:hypothetical protein
VTAREWKRERVVERSGGVGGRAVHAKQWIVADCEWIHDVEAVVHEMRVVGADVVVFRTFMTVCVVAVGMASIVRFDNIIVIVMVIVIVIVMVMVMVMVVVVVGRPIVLVRVASSELVKMLQLVEVVLMRRWKAGNGIKQRFRREKSPTVIQALRQFHIQLFHHIRFFVSAGVVVVVVCFIIKAVATVFVDFVVFVVFVVTVFVAMMMTVMIILRITSSI